MRTLLKATLLAAGLTFFSPLFAMATNPPAVCTTSQEEFYTSAARVNAKILVANDKARTVILDAINNARLSAKMWAFEADKMAIGVMMRNGTMLVGTVMFKDRCVVPGSVKVFPAEQWIAFLITLGLSMDDFSPENGA